MWECASGSAQRECRMWECASGSAQARVRKSGVRKRACALHAVRWLQPLNKVLPKWPARIIENRTAAALALTRIVRTWAVPCAY